MRVDNSTGKGTSGMDKFSSKVHRVYMELGGKLLNPLRIKTQFLERLQSMSVVDGATHTQKDDVESNGGSLENVAEIFVLFFCSVQLDLRYGVLTILDLASNIACCNERLGGNHKHTCDAQSFLEVFCTLSSFQRSRQWVQKQCLDEGGKGKA